MYMLRLIKRNKYLSKVLSGSLMFYAFSGVAALLNYAFYPILGRIISVGEYGEVQFLISTFTQLSVGFVVLNILAIIISVKAHSDTEQAESIKTLNQVAIVIMLPVIIIATAILFFIRDTVNITEPLAIIGLGFSILINIPYTTSIGKLQGNGQFLASGVINTIGALGKVVCSVLLVLLGFGVTGAVAGVGLGTFVAYCIALLLDNNRNKASRKTVYLSKRYIKQITYIRNQSIVAVVVMTLLTILSIFDTITARILLDHASAGQYAAIATTTKTILAATTPLMWLALPYATKNHKKSTNKYIFLTGLVAAAFCIVIFFFNQPIVTILTGIYAGKYLDYTLFASVAMSFCAIAFIYGAIMICRNHLRIVSVSSAIGFVCSLLIFALLYRHDALVAALTVQIIFSTSIIIGGILSTKSEHPDIL